MFRRCLPSLILLSACAPQNASIVEGEFTAFLSGSNSPTYLRKLLKPEEFSQWTHVDCRLLDEDQQVNEALRLGDGPGRDPGKRLPICEDDAGDNKLAAVSEMQETWLRDDGYMVVGDPLDPWRGEAVITSEGDVQLTFHQRLPGGEDFRFGFVVDPDFQPRVCEQNEDGSGVSFNPLNGDWVAEWSKEVEEDGGRLFFLNAYSFQFDAKNFEAYLNDFPNGQLFLWNLPNEWAAGYSEGMFADDRFRGRTVRYGTPASYLSYEATSASLSLIPDVFPEDLYYCQTWDGMEGLESCVLDSRLVDFETCITPVEEEYDACIDDATLAREACLASVDTRLPECVSTEEAKCQAALDAATVGTAEDPATCDAPATGTPEECVAAAEATFATCTAAAPDVCTTRLTDRCDDDFDSAEGTCNRDQTQASVRCAHIFDCAESLFTPNYVAPPPYNLPGGRSNAFSAYKLCAVELAECVRDGDDAACRAEYQSCLESQYGLCKDAMEANVNRDADQVKDDLRIAGLYGFSEADDLPDTRPIVHTNAWRQPDGAPNGFDDWMEINYSWVRFDAGSDLEKGGAATGEFSIVFDAFDSPSRFFVRGKFEVARFKNDIWTPKYLPAIKFEENGMTECGMPPE